MKACVVVLACSISALSGLAQGTVLFDSFVIPVGVNSFIVGPDGMTPPAAGSVYVQLLAGPTETSLAPVGVAIPTLTAGYFLGGDVSIPSVVPGDLAWVQVSAWDARAPTYEAAFLSGLPVALSNRILISTGGGGDPPALATPLVGLETQIVLHVQVPEPTSALLMVFGLGVLGLFWRWRGPFQ